MLHLPLYQHAILQINPITSAIFFCCIFWGVFIEEQEIRLSTLLLIADLESGSSRYVGVRIF